MPAKRDDAVALGKVIEARRDDMGYSRPEMAKVAGISYPYAYEIERGSKYPSADALEKIAAALEVPAQELLSEASARLVNPAVVAEQPPTKRSRAQVARSEPPGLGDGCADSGWCITRWFGYLPKPGRRRSDRARASETRAGDS